MNNIKILSLTCALIATNFILSMDNKKTPSHKKTLEKYILQARPELAPKQKPSPEDITQFLDEINAHLDQSNRKFAPFHRELQAALSKK